MEVFQAATMPMVPEQLVWQQSAVVLDKDRFQHRPGGGGEISALPFSNRRLKKEMLTLLRKIHTKVARKCFDFMLDQGVADT